jgi:hypothetical protein
MPWLEQFNYQIKDFFPILIKDQIERIFNIFYVLRFILTSFGSWVWVTYLGPAGVIFEGLN